MPTRVGRLLFARLSASTRTFVAVIAFLGVAGRLTTAAAAIAIVNGDATLATALGIVVGGVYLGGRVLGALARLGVESDLYRSIVKSLLAADVLRVPTDDVQRAVYEVSHYGPSLVAGTVPALAADVIAALAVAPLVAHRFPGRVLAIAAVGFIAATATLALLRRATQRLQERALLAYGRVMDALVIAIEGRLELVARGGEERFARSFEGTLGRYRADARRSAFGSAVLGRAPLAIGVMIVLGFVLVDRASRDALAGALLSQALLLAAVLPMVLGVVFGAHEAVRVTALLAPLAAIFDAPPRVEVSRGGASIGLPTRVEVEGVSFGYEAGKPLTFEGVSFDWQPPAALVLTGANGAGKSTLLRLLVGLRPPIGGTIRFGGTDLQSLDLVALRRSVAFLPQRPYLGEAYTSLRDALHFGQTAPFDEADLRAVLSRVGLRELLSGDDPLSVRIGELSVGQRQRAALARVLLQNASILLLDEPDANLDRDGILLVRELVQELSASGRMVAVAAHTKELAEASALSVALD